MVPVIPPSLKGAPSVRSQQKSPLPCPGALCPRAASVDGDFRYVLRPRDGQWVGRARRVVGRRLLVAGGIFGGHVAGFSPCRLLTLPWLVCVARSGPVGPISYRGMSTVFNDLMSWTRVDFSYQGIHFHG